MRFIQMDKKILKYGELFCGPGGMAKGAGNVSVQSKGVRYAIKPIWAIDNDEIYIVTGAVLNDVIGRIGSNNVSIPSEYYKVILDYQEPDFKAIGIIMPNQKGDASLSTYAVSIDHVEKITGIDFFPALPDKIEKNIENSFNASDWNWGKSKSYKTIKKSSTSKEVVKSDSERLPAGSSIQCSGKIKKGTRCKKKTLNADGYCNSHRK